MSVHIPIYQRILYGTPTTPNKGDKKASSSDNDHFEKCSRNSTSGIPLESTRHSLSALLIHKGTQDHQIVSRAVSAPDMLFTKPEINGCSQADRWKEREKQLANSRTFKKKSNIISHRQDKGYFIMGSKLPLLDRYDIDEKELMQLRMLAESQAEKSTRGSSAKSSVTHTVSPETGPHGQNGSPIPPSLAVQNEKRKKILERRDQMQDDRIRRKEMRREKRHEKMKRFEEKEKFEKEMEEKYRPKKLEKKSLIFLTEENEEDMGRNSPRVFLTEGNVFNEEDKDSKSSSYSFISNKQRAAFESIFNELDKNKDGRIDIDELRQHLFPHASKENLKHLLQVFDLNKDHMIDMREFITICGLNDKLCGSRRSDDGTTSLALDLKRLAQHITIYKELFAVIDEDGDGRIQTDEILLMITTAVEGNETVDEEKARNVLNNMEKDERGFIDFTSFMSYIPFFAKLLRVIMDSPLSIKNLEQARERIIRKYSRKYDQTTT